MSEAPPDYRAYRRVLRMVQELHLRGYQRLRIAPGMAPSGLGWRCAVTPVTNILGSHGARLADWEGAVAHYSTDMASEPFGWRDARRAQPSRLAEMFLARFPEIAAAGAGSDWPYAGWYVEMLHLTYPDALPYCYSDWEEQDIPGIPTIGGRQVRIPMPPSGEAEDTAPQPGPTPLGRRSQCPNCGSRSVARIQFGMPAWSPKLERDLELGRVVLGGCCVTDHDPDRQCNVCRHSWRPPQGRAGKATRD